jgi:hypothetical protein
LNKERETKGPSKPGIKSLVEFFSETREVILFLTPPFQLGL